MFIDGNLADVVQITRRPQCDDPRGFHPQTLGYAGRVASYAQRMSMHVHVLDVDSRGESLKRALMKSVERRYQLQILVYALRQTAREGVVVYGQRYIIGEKAESFQVLRVIRAFSGTTA